MQPAEGVERVVLCEHQRVIHPTRHLRRLRRHQSADQPGLVGALLVAVAQPTLCARAPRVHLTCTAPAPPFMFVSKWSTTINGNCVRGHQLTAIQRRAQLIGRGTLSGDGKAVAVAHGGRLDLDASGNCTGSGLPGSGPDGGRPKLPLMRGRPVPQSTVSATTHWHTSNVGCFGGNT